MSRLQKMARFNLIALVLNLILSAIFILWVVANDGTSHIMVNLAGLGNLWLLFILFSMLSSEVWAKKKRPNEVSFDERDLLIQTKALQIGTLTFLGTLLYMRWLIIPPYGSVLIFLPVLLGTSAFIGAFTYSTAILIQYGWGGKDGEK